jgi:hypothetical protein
MLTLSAQRLHNQQIANPACQSPGAVVAWMGALQGQDYIGAKWSIGLRLPGSTEADIERAFTEGELVRTWAMRGTLMVVNPADVRWMVALLGPRIVAGNARRYRELELDGATLLRGNALLEKALADGPLTRRELLPLLDASGISTAGQRGVHMLQRASLDGLICQTEMKGNNNPAFKLMEQAAPHGKILPRDEALAELARRYYFSRGPATLYDFAWWTGLLMADVRAAFDAIKAELAEDVIDGVSYWRAPDDPVPAPEPLTVYLPPGFDEYLLGYKDRDVVLDPEHADKVCPGGNGIFKPTLVIDGRIVGIWKRTFKKREVVMELQPFTAFNRRERDAIEAAAQPFGAFYERAVAMT